MSQNFQSCLIQGQFLHSVLLGNYKVDDRREEGAQKSNLPPLRSVWHRYYEVNNASSQSPKSSFFGEDSTRPVPIMPSSRACDGM